ncbi:MAG: hypothetical protein NXI02_28950 [Rhodobacteraceae bacterium]|nr:hypothetical protein [Paracoccaceae bacterium]
MNNGPLGTPGPELSFVSIAANDCFEPLVSRTGSASGGNDTLKADFAKFIERPIHSLSLQQQKSIRSVWGMINWVFQETSFLAIRRSMVITSVLLALILIYRIDVLVPFTETAEAKTIIDHRVSSLSLAFYLIYLILRWRPHSKKYLHAARGSSREATKFSKSLEEARALVDQIKQVGANPLEPLLPSDEELESKAQIVQNKLTETHESINRAETERKKFEDCLENLRELVGDPSAPDNDQNRNTLEFQTSPSIENIKKNLQNAVHANSADWDHIISRNSICKQEVTSLVETFRNEASTEKMISWANGLEKQLSGFTSERNKVLRDLKNDAITWDVRLPLVVSVVMVILTAFLVPVEQFLGVETAPVKIQCFITELWSILRQYASSIRTTYICDF